jgi:hypothetical protein
VGNLLWTFGSEFIQPVDKLGIPATLIDETGEAAVTPALTATHAQYIELADEITEDDGTVAGHGRLYSLLVFFPYHSQRPFLGRIYNHKCK